MTVNSVAILMWPLMMLLGNDGDHDDCEHGAAKVAAATSLSLLQTVLLPQQLLLLPPRPYHTP